MLAARASPYTHMYRHTQTQTHARTQPHRTSAAETKAGELVSPVASGIPGLPGIQGIARESSGQRERAVTTGSLSPLCVCPFPPTAGTMDRQT